MPTCAASLVSRCHPKPRLMSHPCVAAGNRTLLPCGRRAGRHLLFLYIEHDANRRCVRRRRVCNLVVMAAAGTRTAGLVGPAMAHKSGAATRFFDSLRRPACRPGLLGTFRRRPTSTALKLELYYNITCRLAGVRAAHRFVRPTSGGFLSPFEHLVAPHVRLLRAYSAAFDALAASVVLVLPLGTRFICCHAV